MLQRLTQPLRVEITGPAKRRVVAFAACLAGLLAVAPAPAIAALYGVVVGVDRYVAAPDLRGAVADARDIAGALRDLGGAVTLLTDEQATRAAVTQAFRDAAAQARPGDAIVFSFAGHGVQEPEAHAGEEADGFDETLLFGGFRPSGPDTAQRLRDNEVAALFAQAAPGVSILFVVDACHSGTMTRALDPRGRQASVRLATLGQIFNDALPLPPPAPESLTMGPSLPDVLFMAAAAEHEQVPEVMIDGQSRGALSWALARALEGGAGADPDALTPTAFARYARATVRSLAAGRQNPQFAWTPGPDAPPTLLPPGAVSDAARARLRARGAGPPPLPRVAAPGMDDAIAALTDVLQPTRSMAEADLMWDPATGEVVDLNTADVVGLADSVAGVGGAARRWRAERALAGFQPQRAFDFRIEPEAAVRRIGDMVHLVTPRPERRPESLLIVNLAGDGVASLVFPPLDMARAQALVTPGPAPLRLGPAPITPPLGADLVVAVRCGCDLRDLAAMTAGRGAEAGAFVAALRRRAESERMLIGVASIYTWR